MRTKVLNKLPSVFNIWQPCLCFYSIQPWFYGRRSTEQEKNSTAHPRKLLIAGHSLIIIGISEFYHYTYVPPKNYLIWELFLLGIIYSTPILKSQEIQWPRQPRPLHWMQAFELWLFNILTPYFIWVRVLVIATNRKWVTSCYQSHSCRLKIMSRNNAVLCTVSQL